MLKILMIGAFGGAGAILRHFVGVWSVHWFGSGFPVGTLIVNVAGRVRVARDKDHNGIREGADGRDLTC